MVAYECLRIIKYISSFEHLSEVSTSCIWQLCKLSNKIGLAKLFKTTWKVCCWDRSWQPRLRRPSPFSSTQRTKSNQPHISLIYKTSLPTLLLCGDLPSDSSTITTAHEVHQREPNWLVRSYIFFHQPHMNHIWFYDSVILKPLLSVSPSHRKTKKWITWDHVGETI